MKKYKLYQIDAFTLEKFTGNPAGVVTNADGLTETQMQKIAREMNNSETAFILSSNCDDYDVRVRFFTPTSEVPICGHATVAAHYARALENKIDSSRVLQMTGAGILPVDIRKEDQNYKIIMTQGKIEFGDYLVGRTKEMLLNALNMQEEELLDNEKIQIVSTGHSKVMVGIKDINVLHNLKPNFNELTQLSSIIHCNGFYIYTFNPDSDILIHGRMFAPAIGINEDPVTGNANGPLGAYLVHHRLVKHDSKHFQFKVMQGEAINRAGMIEVEVEIEDNEPIEVKISGNAVTVFETELTVE